MSKLSSKRKLTDRFLETLLDFVEPLQDTNGRISIRASSVYSMVSELIELREELFRIRLCETVDKIIDDNVITGNDLNLLDNNSIIELAEF